MFGIHLLRTDQWDLIWHLGLHSARVVDKMATVAYRIGETGCPLLQDCMTAYECRVVNVMDAGASTFFLGDVVSVTEVATGEVMTSEYYRRHIPANRKQEYEARLLEAQAYLEPLSHEVDRCAWPGAIVQP